MKILFVAPIDKDAGVHNWGAPSLGIMRITSYLKSKFGDNLDIDIYDTQIDGYDPHVKYWNTHVDVLGISVLHYTLLNTLGFINKWRKRHLETKICVGGNEAASNYQTILDNSDTDFIILSEGERPMADIIKFIRGEMSLQNIDGIIFRNRSLQIDENSFWKYWSCVDFSKYRYKEYWKRIADLYDEPDYEKINYVRLAVSSHCNQKCTFCSLSRVRDIASGGKEKPVSLTGEQIMTLVHRINEQLPETRTIYFCNDNVFYPNPNYFLDFIDIYTKSNYDYRILVQTASYSLSEKRFAALKRLGCQHITVGVENASPAVRKSLCKNQSSERIEQIIEWSKKYNIPVYYLIILIPPESTIDDLVINYRTIKQWVNKGVQISIEPLIYSYKGTQIYENADYEHTWVNQKIQGTDKVIKDSIYILPKRKEVKELALEFKEREKEWVDNCYKKLNHKHKFKGQTSYFLLELLGQLLRERNIEIGE